MRRSGGAHEAGWGRQRRNDVSMYNSVRPPVQVPFVTRDKHRPTLDRAFDELRFGHERVLNLRVLQPTALQATEFCERWLRSGQVQGMQEALIITGRGNNSVDGFSPVRHAIARLLPSLRRRNVIAGYQEHTPGSFVVTFAAVSQLFEVPRRRREKPAAPARPSGLAGLEEETATRLQELAVMSLGGLGVLSPTRAQLEDEMLRHFAAIVSALPDDSDREARLQQALLRAQEEYESR